MEIRCIRCGIVQNAEEKDLGHLIFLRHGETDLNKRKICVGSLDVPLNSLGYKQAGEAADGLKDFGITRVFASPLVRAFETAVIIAKKIGAGISADSCLRERMCGVLEGKPENSESEKSLFRYDFCPENGELLWFFEKKTKDLIDRYAEISMGKAILLVTHSFRILTVAKIIRRLSFDEVSEIKIPNGKWIQFIYRVDPCRCGSNFFEE